MNLPEVTREVCDLFAEAAALRRQGRRDAALAHSKRGAQLMSEAIGEIDYRLWQIERWLREMYAQGGGTRS